jgi:photosystem II stability/assembly factor-like uncharacterized protein
MKLKKQLRVMFIVLCMVFLAFSPFKSYGNTDKLFDEDLLKNFKYRNLGPFRSGSWITDFAVPESPPEAHLYTFYVASRNGGLWKTINNGTTFEPIFDDQDVISIGDIALAPSNADIVWVGTGEAANARSSYWGDGVYKSTDAGKTWKNMGLKDSHHIGRIVVHPKNPEIVYVAAMGHLFSSNEERGVFKTIDGGKTWQKVLYINEKVGVIDIALNRNDPDILYAAAYEKQRLPWHFEEGGPGSAIYKTLDGGENWTKLGGGLPGGKIGRIGLDIYLKNPDIVYAVIENANKRPPTKKEVEQDRSRGLKPQDRIFGGEVYRTDDAGETWVKMNSIEDNVGGKAAYSFCQIRVDPNNDKNVYVTSICVANSADGGKTWSDVDWPPRKMFPRSFGDVRTLWVDPQNSNRILMGSDGGVHISYDRGKTCDYYDNLPLAQYYAIGVDMEEPYNIYGGLQCHESWKGPSNSWSGRITLEDWVTVGSGDGMYNQVDPTDSRWLYNTSQFGGHHRVDQKLGTRTNIQPRREEGKPPYRFNWCPPVHISPHNSEIIYAGTQVLLRSMHRGDDWQEISPDLTENDAVKIAGRGHIQYCTVTTISESPVTPGVIWVGTDDGKVWLTKDSGTSWAEMTKKIAGMGGPENYWVSRVFASNFEAGTAYVSKSGFRRDDFRPFLYKTSDFGKTWTSIAANLPDRPINVIFEDRKNRNLLFLGTDNGVYVSIDGGARWEQMRNNMPTVAVHDLLVHPRENDLVVGTYGRGIFITDITPLQEMNEKVLAEKIYFFKVEPKVQWMAHTYGGNYNLYGRRHLSTPNEPDGVVINYYLKDEVKEKVKITIADSDGKIISRLEGEANAGINSVIWNMRRQPTKEEAAQMWRRRRGILVPPGEYVVILEVGDKKLTQKALIKKRAGWTIGPKTSESLGPYR